MSERTFYLFWISAAAIVGGAILGFNAFKLDTSVSAADFPVSASYVADRVVNIDLVAKKITLLITAAVATLAGLIGLMGATVLRTLETRVPEAIKRTNA